MSGRDWLVKIFLLLTNYRLVGSVALLVLLFVRFQDFPIVSDFRNQAFDYYQQIKPREFTRQPVSIIDIDEASLRKYGQWPWPRSRIAELLQKLGQQGAVVTGFDIVFAEDDRLSPSKIVEDNERLPPEVKAQLRQLPDNEEIMAQVMSNLNVVVGQTSVRQASDAGEDAPEISDTSHGAIGDDPRPFLINFPDLVQNVPELEQAAKGRGVFTVLGDPDGVIRRVPLVMLVRDKMRLALAPEILRVATGGFSFTIKTNAAGLEGIIIAKNFIKTDQNGNIWPYLTRSKPSRYISAADVLDGVADQSRIAGHMLIMGPSAAGLEDYRATAIGESMPGVEVHAQIIESILSGQMLERPSTMFLAELLISGLAGLIILVLVPKLGAIWAFVAAVTTMGAFAAGSFYGFSEHRLLIDPTFPVAMTFIMFMLGATGNYIREERQRRQIRGAFGQYLSPALVDQLNDDPDKLVLGGETKELTLLFTDVRGFTTISESYKDHPQGLTKLMNHFLTVLSQPILDNNGTIDKYMGDAIMAFWNAPVDEEDHAYLASISALQMIENVQQLNESRKEQLADGGEVEFHAINVGVGINTGPCVVGNMGSDNRFDYTALGDTVNLASRLEGQSKPYGLNIVIGESTSQIIADRLAIFEIDLIRVKGKNEGVHIFCLAGDDKMMADEDFKAFRAMNASMLSSYRNQDWQSAFEALEMMEQLGEKLGLGLDEYLFIYETRIAEFRANPPGSSWDGVYTATSK